MDARLTIPEDLIDRIADRVLEKLLPYLEDREQDEILSVDQVAVLLGKTKGTVYQLVHASSHGLCDLPFQKSGRTLRFSRKAVINWMENNAKRLEKR